MYEKGSNKTSISLGPPFRPRPNRGNYMFHCHNLLHEDYDMLMVGAVTRTL